MQTRNRLDLIKPAAPARVHLLLAAAMWTVVGGLLAFFGVRWVLTADLGLALPLLVVAAVGGGLKARFMLDRAARRTIERIRSRGDGRCIGGFLSLRTWGFVLLMAVAGRLLRGSPLPRVAVGFVYAAVGLALLLASRLPWQAWYRHHEQAEG
jgi:hypothetical protein